MERIRELIDSIEGLYPVDSQYESTNEVGKQLLMEAIEEFNWRNLPEELLAMYERKCIKQENYEANRAFRKNDY